MTMTALGMVGCLEGQATGQDPPNDQLFFPMGLAFHPDYSPDADIDETRRNDEDVLYVACGNNDLRYNGGALQGYDLEDLWRIIDPNGSPALKAQIASRTTKKDEVRARTDAWRANLRARQQAAADGTSPADPAAPPPCRLVPGKEQVIECHEAGFALGGFQAAHMGQFASDLASYSTVDDDGVERKGLLMPVRGDPSVTRFELDGDRNYTKPFCGQADADADPDDGVDEAQCAADYRLTNLYGDPDGTGLPLEPYRIAVSGDFAYLTHTGSRAVTLIGLRGPYGVVPGDAGLELAPDDAYLFHETPTIIDLAPISVANVDGGYGIAERPCDPADAPTITAGCTRPMLVSSLRFARGINQFTAFADLSPFTSADDSATADDFVCLGTETHEALEKDDWPASEPPPRVVQCQPQLQIDATFSPGGLQNPGATAFTPTLGAMSYSADGDELFVVQTTPGALLRIDTSVDGTGTVRNFSAGQVEVCSRASELELFEDPAGIGGRFGLVSCYLVGQVYIVDLDSFQTVGVVQVGTGPHHMLADPVRKVVYVANVLDATVSVIDMNRENVTRFSEIGRLGLQQPFSGDRN